MKTLSKIAMAVGLGFCAQAMAEPTLYVPETLLEDDNTQFIHDNDSDGFISVGDRLVAVAEFARSINTTAFGLDDFTTIELTAVLDVTVATKTPTGDPLKFDFTFTPSSTLGTGYLAGFTPGTIAALYVDPTPDLVAVSTTNCALGEVECVERAGLSQGLGIDTDSVLWLTAGHIGDADEYYLATDALDSIAGVTATSSGTDVGFFNFGMTIMGNYTGRQLIKDSLLCAPEAFLNGFCTGNGLIDITGSGTLVGGASAALVGGFAQGDAEVVLRVPEPATLALFGMGLIGMAGFRRKKAR